MGCYLIANTIKGLIMFSKIKKGLSGLVALAVTSVASVAHAALPVAATDAITAIQTDGTAMIDAGWPVAVAIFGGLIIVKLFKKVLTRVT